MLNRQCSQIIAAGREQGWLTEPAAKRLLDHYGVPVPDFRVAANPAEALAAARAVGYPVAAKVVSAQIVHKTEVNGVVLGLADGDAVMAVFERFAALPRFCLLYTSPSPRDHG